MRVVLSAVHFSEPCSLDSYNPVSVALESEVWWIEANWDGSAIGDVVLYRATNAQQAAYRQGIKDNTVQEGVYQKGEYFGAVPAVHVKCYRFKHGEPQAQDEQQVQVAPTPQARTKQAGTQPQS